MRKRLLLPLVCLVFLSACGLLPEPRQPEPIQTLTPITILITPMQTPTATQPPPTPTQLPTKTLTPLPSHTPTQTIPPPTASPVPFQLQAGSGRFLPAFTHADLGCKWAGIAGQVMDANGQGIEDITVIITGQVDGRPVDQVGVTSGQSPYGPGGYELQLSDHFPAAGHGLLIQLFDVQGHVLSAPLPFSLPPACDQNLVLVTFQVGNSLAMTYLPQLARNP